MSNTHKIIGLLSLTLLFGCRFATNNNSGNDKTETLKYERVFKDLKSTLAKDNLWNHQLYGPLMLVNRKDRSIIANEADNNGLLTQQGAVYTGVLPKEFNISNTSFKWNDKQWTMVALPLPDDKHERLNLLTHELFHGIQDEIGFDNLREASCYHLDLLDGRIYLKLELEALKEALSTTDQGLQNKQIQNALLFRAYRHQLFPDAKERENMLEIHEGLAEYTGSTLSGRSDKALREHYIDAIEGLYQNPSFVRSFAYRTTPVYGYFIKQKDDGWNLKINKETNLTEFTTDALGISLPSNLGAIIVQIRDAYRYTELAAFEKERDQKQKALIAEFDAIFQKNNTLIIPLQKMRIGFNPSNLIPFKDLGTLYLDLRITDNWGILKAEKGALVTKDWSKVILTEPLEMGDNILKGDGWKIELNKAWKIEKTDDYYTLKMH